MYIFRHGLYGFASARNSLEMCREKDRESLLQCNNPGTVASLQLYRVDTSASPALLTGNGHVSRGSNSRYTCSQHGPAKCFAEQGTQTLKTFQRYSRTMFDEGC